MDDFSSLGIGSEVYVLKLSKQDGMKYVKGVVKQKTDSLIPQQPISIVVNADNEEISFQNVPTNLTVVQKGDVILAVSSKSLGEHVKMLVENSKRILGEQTYHEQIITSGETVMEQLLPEYAETQRQAKLLRDLQSKQSETDQRMQTIENQNNEIITLLRKLNIDK